MKSNKQATIDRKLLIEGKRLGGSPVITNEQALEHQKKLDEMELQVRRKFLQVEWSKAKEAYYKSC